MKLLGPVLPQLHVHMSYILVLLIIYAIKKCEVADVSGPTATTTTSTSQAQGSDSAEFYDQTNPEDHVVSETVTTENTYEEPTPKKSKQNGSKTLTPVDLYQRLFEQKRNDHMQAVATIMQLPGYEKQYKMIKLILDKMFKVVSDAKVKLMESGFTPGDPFPTDDGLKDAFSNILENTAFFGDILLRMPDATQDILLKNREWNVVVRWAIVFCNESGIFKDQHLKMLDLVAQELNLIDKSPDYVNPYKESTTEEIVEDEINQILKEKKKEEKKKQRKEKKKGPRLSRPKVEL